MADEQARKHAIQKASTQVRSGGGFVRRAATASVQRPRYAAGAANDQRASKEAPAA